MEGADMPNLLSAKPMKSKRKGSDYTYIIVALSSLVILVYLIFLAYVMTVYSVSIWSILSDIQLITSVFSSLVIIILGAMNHPKFPIAGIGLSGFALAVFLLQIVIDLIEGGDLSDLSSLIEDVNGILYLSYLILNLGILIFSILQWRKNQKRIFK